MATQTAAKKKAAAAKKNAGKKQANLAGITLAMVQAHPELGAIRKMYVAGNYSGALAALKETNFYKNNTAQAIQNQNLKATQPGVYQQTIDTQWLPNLKAYVTQQGLEISDDDLRAVAEQAFSMGLDVSAYGQGRQAVFNMLGSYVTGVTGGTGQQAINELKATAMAMGVNYSNSWFDQAAVSVANGNATIEQYSQAIKDSAKSRFPQFADQIDAGQTVADIASPYVNSMASVLEIDPATITLNDPTVTKGLNQVGSDGKPVPMGLWDFEKSLRQDPRWNKTKNARDAVDATARQILSDFGLAY